MDFVYSFATAWIVIGTFVYIWHNVYVWTSVSDSFKSEITTFHFFLMSVALWPAIASIVTYIIIDVEIKFRKWKKENGYK